MSYTLYPTALDTFTDKVDGVDDVLAADFNKLQDAMSAMEVKMGVNNSGDTSTFEWKLNNVTGWQSGLTFNERIALPFSGAPGAPRIQTAAINDAAVTAPKLATTTAERDWVLGRTAGADVGAVGTYAFMYYDHPTATFYPGQNVSASLLYYASDGTYNEISIALSQRPSGTWKCMGYMQASYLHQTVFLRIA